MRERDLVNVVSYQRRNWLHALQHFHPRLGLAGFRSLGLETINKRLQALALRLLLFGMFCIEQFACGALLLEQGIAAAVKRELAAIEMKDLIDRRLEQIAIMADHYERARIIRKMILKPQCAFEIKIIGWLVQQEQVGSGKK